MMNDWCYKALRVNACEEINVASFCACEENNIESEAAWFVWNQSEKAGGTNEETGEIE